MDDFWVIFIMHSNNLHPFDISIEKKNKFLWKFMKEDIFSENWIFRISFENFTKNFNIFKRFVVRMGKMSSLFGYELCRNLMKIVVSVKFLMEMGKIIIKCWFLKFFCRIRIFIIIFNIQISEKFKLCSANLQLCHRDYSKRCFEHLF